MELLTYWAQFMNNYLNFRPERTNEEAVCLAVLFFYVLPRHANIMTDKGFNFFGECAANCLSVPAGRGVHLFILRGQ